MENKNKFKGKRFILQKPGEWGLDFKKIYIAAETPNGYAIRVGKDEWIGLPKRLVENQPTIFTPAENEYRKGE